MAYFNSNIKEFKRLNIIILKDSFHEPSVQKIAQSRSIQKLHAALTTTTKKAHKAPLGVRTDLGNFIILVKR